MVIKKREKERKMSEIQRKTEREREMRDHVNERKKFDI